VATYLKGAEPFELGEARGRACLLVHGFTGSPYEMRPLGERLAGAGWLAAAPALAGHATDPDDLDRTGWRDWVGTADAALTALKARCPSVSVVGLSMGGLVAAELAAARPADVDAVAILAAPLWLSGRNGMFVTAARFTPLARVLPSVRKTVEKDPRLAAIRARNPSYDRVPTRAAAAFWDFMWRMRRRLRDVRAPALVVYSRADADVPFVNAALVARALGSRDLRRVTLDGSAHLMTLDRDAPRVCGEVLAFFDHHSPRS
jgi:carboxylesterase